MSDNIDYDELDRAIAETQKQTSTKRATKTRSATTATKSKSTATPKKAAPKAPTVSAQPVYVHNTSLDTAQKFQPRRRVYMDFIARPNRQSVEIMNAVRLKNATQEPPKKVAHFATATPDMPSYRIANSRKPTHSQAVPTTPVVRNATPAANVQPVSKHVVVPNIPTRTVTPAKPTVTKVAAPVEEKPVEQPVVKAEPSRTAIAAENVIKALENGPTAPNANNYSLGVRSPYLRKDAIVEKRPLNGDISDYVQDEKIEKNEYPEQDHKATKKKKSRNKHTVKKSEKTNSNWYWPILVILIVAAGGGLGYLLWWILQVAQ